MDRRERDTVLIVEPDPELRRAFAMAVDAVGYSTVTAADGDDAINCLKGGLRPAVIVLALEAPHLDIVNPSMDGRRFRVWLDANRRGCPLIVLASGRDAEAAGRMLEAARSLEKPVAAQDVAAAVDALVRHR